MYRTIISRLGQTLGSPTPWLFLLGAVAVGLLGEGASKAVDAWVAGISVKTSLLTLLLGALVLLVTIVLFNVPIWLRSTLAQPRKTSIAIEEHVPHQRGLIALVSLGSYVPAENALAYHSWAGVPGSQSTLTHCWLLAGPGEGEQSSRKNADRLAEMYAAKGITIEVWPLRDADDPEEIYRAVKLIYQIAQSKYKLPKEEIIADYTGGTKSMTAGMVLAAIEHGGQMQHMKPNNYELDGRADRAAGSRPQLVQVNFVKVDEVG